MKTLTNQTKFKFVILKTLKPDKTSKNQQTGGLFKKAYFYNTAKQSNSLAQLTSEFSVFVGLIALAASMFRPLLLVNESWVTQHVLRSFIHELHKFLHIKAVICELLVSSVCRMMTLY